MISTGPICRVEVEAEMTEISAGRVITTILHSSWQARFSYRPSIRRLVLAHQGVSRLKQSLKHLLAVDGCRLLDRHWQKSSLAQQSPRPTVRGYVSHCSRKLTIGAEMTLRRFWKSVLIKQEESGKCIYFPLRYHWLALLLYRAAVR